jgi:catechol 2,3-dioxygenase-like lactoylglutathione lyase family enzyme
LPASAAGHTAGQSKPFAEHFRRPDAPKKDAQHGRIAMALAFMEHFLIQSADIEATKDWWVNVLGMRVGPSPDFKFPVYWLYIGERDVLHLTQGGANVSANRMKYLGQQSQATEGSGVVDHIGFRAHGLEDTIAHLKELGVKFTERQVDDQGLYQLFLLDPNGVKVELNFSASEVKGRKATVMASELFGAPN